VEEPEPEVEEAARSRGGDRRPAPRPPVRRHTKRPVTLDELISELKKAELVGRRKAMRERWPSTEEKELDLSTMRESRTESRRWAILDDMFMEKPTVTFQDINSKNGMTEDRLPITSRCSSWPEKAGLAGAGGDLRDLFVSRHA